MSQTQYRKRFIILKGAKHRPMKTPDLDDSPRQQTMITSKLSLIHIYIFNYVCHNFYIRILKFDYNVLIVLLLRITLYQLYNEWEYELTILNKRLQAG